MKFTKRIVALSLVTTAALSLIFAAPAKQAKHAEGGQASLLCEFYTDHEYRYC